MPNRHHTFLPGTVSASMKRAGWLCAICLCGTLTGCAAFTNPVAEGVPVNKLPAELRGQTREDQQGIPLSYLRQPTPDVYRLAAGDVLGIFIEGVLGEKNQSPPVYLTDRAEGAAPALGFPLPIRDDGTLPLPLIKPLRVDGMSLSEAEKAIREAYINEKIILDGSRTIVTLIKPRQNHILVIRQDPATLGSNIITVNGSFGGGSEVIGSGIAGTGHVIDLPAYENDVLNALARTGGLPAANAADFVVIYRNAFKGDKDNADAKRLFNSLHRGCAPTTLAGAGGPVIRIPLRLKPGEEPRFRPEDIILYKGDTVFVEGNKTELFYTGGLLPSGEHVLPRDFDLDVVNAVARVRGPLVNGGVSTSNLSGSIVAPGLGNPSPSLLSVIRRTPGCGLTIIRVDLNCALRDPSQRILVQPNDMLILQETPAEALTRYTTQMVKFDFLFTHFRHRDGVGTANIVVP